MPDSSKIRLVVASKKSAHAGQRGELIGTIVTEFERDFTHSGDFDALFAVGVGQRFGVEGGGPLLERAVRCRAADLKCRRKML